MRIASLCAWMLAVSSAAQAAPPPRCVVVRKPTAQQREESAAEVERLLDLYEAKTSDNTGWPAALAEVYDRFPLPSVNMLIALHHPAWSAPEKKLLAYAEATRQDPGDYADPSAVAQTIQRIKQTLLPEVQDRPLLMIEARGMVRREDIVQLDVHIGNEMCRGDLVPESGAYAVSWADGGGRLSAIVTPQRVGEGGDFCIAIERESIGPCDGTLNPVGSATAAASESLRTPPPPERPVPIPAKQPVITPSSPSLDYRLAVPGLALTAVGFGLAAVARIQVENRMDRAERGADPQCQDRRCSPAGMSDVLAARDWTTAYYVTGVTGLVGIAAVIASGHRYYAEWFLPGSKRADERLSGSPRLIPVATRAGAGIWVESRF